MRLKIGGSGDCIGFNGLIDEVQIFNRVVSASKIKAIYDAGSMGQCKERHAPLFRQWNGQDHFYTISEDERDGAFCFYQYRYDGIACYVFSYPEPGTVPLYRLNNSLGDHFYTASTAERDNAAPGCGYIVEGIACYVFKDPAAGTIPLYRLFNGVDHFYTTSIDERANALSGCGYWPEGIACYVFSQ